MASMGWMVQITSVAPAMNNAPIATTWLRKITGR